MPCPELNRSHFHWRQKVTYTILDWWFQSCKQYRSYLRRCFQDHNCQNDSFFFHLYVKRCESSFIINHPFACVYQRLILLFHNELDSNSFWALRQHQWWARRNLPDEWLICFCSPLCSNCASWCFRKQVHSLPASLVLFLKVWHLSAARFIFFSHHVF